MCRQSPRSLVAPCPHPVLNYMSCDSCHIICSCLYSYWQLLTSKVTNNMNNNWWDMCHGMELAYLGTYIKVEVECTVKVVFSLSFAISTFPISRYLDFRSKENLNGPSGFGFLLLWQKLVRAECVRCLWAAGWNIGGHCKWHLSLSLSLSLSLIFLPAHC